LHPRCSILTNLTECPLQRERVAVFLHVGTKAAQLFPFLSLKIFKIIKGKGGGGGGGA